MPTDDKPAATVEPQTPPAAEQPATGKVRKAAKPRAETAKRASRASGTQESAQSEEVTAVSATPEAAPDVAEMDADGRKKKEKEKKNKKKAKKKEKKNKEAVIIRFDDAQLPQIDARAEALGLSRAAWVRMVVAKALS